MAHVAPPAAATSAAAISGERPPNTAEEISRPTANPLYRTLGAEHLGEHGTLRAREGLDDDSAERDHGDAG